MSQYDRIRTAVLSGEAREQARQKRMQEQRLNAQANRPRKVCPACGKAFQQIGTENWCAGCLNKQAWKKNWAGEDHG